MSTPPVQRRTPAELAALALRVPVEAVTSVEPIKHGLTNESWLVRTAGDAVIVRASTVADDALLIDRRSEAQVLEEVARAGIGAPVLLCDPVQRVLVTRHAGRTWTPDEAMRDANVSRVAHLLRRLHGLPIPAGVRRVDLGAIVSGYLQTLDERGIRVTLATQAMRECAEQVAQALRRGGSECLCHNDVHHLNIVDDGEIRLIDWEYAGAGEPLFDLASICVYHRYPKPKREQLLSEYASGLPSQASSMGWRRLELACWLFDYIRDLWLAVRQAT